MTTIYAIDLGLPGHLTEQELTQFEVVFSELLDSEATSHLRDTSIDDASVDWRIEALFLFAPDMDIVTDLLAPAFASLGIEPRTPNLRELEQRDWLAENRAAFPPLRIGKFWVHGSHVEAPVPAGAIPLLIEAAQAFGSGTHPTTDGCMRALQMLHATQRQRPARILDMGCGSAILGMAAAKLYPHAFVMAADNDPIAVRVAARNVRLNGISPAKMRCVVSAGFAGRDVRREGPYDLILANILAGPLRKMARSLMPHLSQNGWLILSGILNEQALAVERAYTAQGARCWGMLRLGDWTTIILRPARAGGVPALWQGRSTEAEYEDS